MKKSAFRKVSVIVEKEEREIWVLETPALLNRLKKEKTITEEQYNDKLKTYTDSLELKKTLPEEYEGNLRDYQIKTVMYAKEFDSFAIFDEPRLGKTPTTISILKEKKLLDKKIVVLSPANVIENWITAFEEWGNVKAVKYNGEEIKNNILVMTYARSKISNKEILKWKPDVAILDEAHVLRNSKGKAERTKLTKKQEIELARIEQLKQRKKMGFEITESQKQEIKNYSKPITQNKAILKIGSIAKHKYALTGTPNVNDIEDIFAILQFILPKFFKSFWSFVYYYFDVGKNYWGANEIGEIKDKEKEKEIQELLDYISTRNVQKHQMKWLKPPKLTTKYLEMTETQKKLEFNLLENGMVKNKFVLDTLEQMIHYNTICLSPKILDIDDLGSKIKYIIEDIKESKQQNIAIFSTRNKFIEVIKKELEKDFPNKEIIEIKNHSESKKVQNYINDRKNKKENLIFLGTIGKNKEGISLVGIKKAYIADQSWVPTDIEQLTHRLDATTPEEQKHFGEKEFVILQHKGTIDEIVQSALNIKLSRTEIINKYQEFVKMRGEKKMATILKPEPTIEPVEEKEKKELSTKEPEAKEKSKKEPKKKGEPKTDTEPRVVKVEPETDEGELTEPRVVVLENYFDLKELKKTCEGIPPLIRLALLKKELRSVIIRKDQPGYSGRYFYTELKTLQKEFTNLELKHGFTSVYSQEKTHLGEQVFVDATRTLYDLLTGDEVISTKIDITDLIINRIDPTKDNTIHYLERVLQISQPRDAWEMMTLNYFDPQKKGAISTYFQKYTYYQLYDFQETDSTDIDKEPQGKDKTTPSENANFKSKRQERKEDTQVAELRSTLRKEFGREKVEPLIPEGKMLSQLNLKELEEIKEKLTKKGDEQ